MPWAAPAMRSSNHGEPDAVVRFNLDMPRGYLPFPSDASGPDVTITDDGSAVAFPATDPQGARELYVRRLDELDAHALPGTEGGSRRCPSGEARRRWWGTTGT